MFDNMNFKHRAGLIVAALLFLIITPDHGLVAQERFDKPAFYKVMGAGDLKSLNEEIDRIKASALNDNDKKGYEGSLLMRKAGKVKVPAHKLNLFREGAGKMESAIRNDPENTEFHFLRLTIQENVPKIVHYRNSIEKDRLHVIKNFKSQPEFLKAEITEYCKISKVLRAEDL
jgi:hypothetical protein